MCMRYSHVALHKVIKTFLNYTFIHFVLADRSPDQLDN